MGVRVREREMNELKAHRAAPGVGSMKQFAEFLHRLHTGRGIFHACRTHLIKLEGEPRALGLTVYPSDV
jgi:hypothetical protein